MTDNVLESVPFFNVADVKASVKFYVDGLGFTMTHHWSPDGELRWCKLQHGGAGLMLQQFATEGHDAWKPSCKVGEGVTVYFICKDALAIYHQAKRNGLNPARPFVGNSMWVTQLTDPDGYRIAFESDTDAPEESVYDESGD